MASRPSSGSPGGPVALRLDRARTDLALRACSLAGALSRRLGRGGGAVIGGRLALRVQPTVLGHLAAGRRTVLVTGTNGKTTTSHLIAAALGTLGQVAHNDSGANMPDGLVAALARRRSAVLAVLEVDELHLGVVSAAVSPAVLVLLNLSRDQLDRSSEVATVAANIRASLEGRPDTLLVANCDDPLVTAAVDGHPRVCWFAGGSSWSADSRLCPRCGAAISRDGETWCCRSCGLARPDPDWTVAGGTVTGPGVRVALALRLPGSHNTRNAVAALAAAAALGVHPVAAAAAMGAIRSVAHRYATVQVGHHRLTLLLAKNPAGWLETFPLVRDAPGLVVAINAQEADGRDTSWLWDVPFEQLGRGLTVASGDAAADVGLRLGYAAVRHTTITDPFAAVASLPPGDVTVVANYTAFRQMLAGLERARVRLRDRPDRPREGSLRGRRGAAPATWGAGPARGPEPAAAATAPPGLRHQRPAPR